MRSDAIIAWSLLAIFTVLITLFLITTNKSEIKEKIPLIRNWKVFYCWLGSIAFLGGITAFFLPIALNSGFNKGDDGSPLRQALLYTTGGVLGVITLGETHRKNNHEKEKNENDHIRQMHAERRSRYTTAIEQLANENAAIRLGGIYTLAGLVDEWLTDKSIKEENDRRQEGQVIINNLCAYIRSPFLPAERLEAHEVRQRLKAIEKFEANLLPYETTPQYQDISKRYKRFIENSPYKEPEDIAVEYAKLYEEQDIRRSIFTMMSNRVNRFDKKQGKSIPGLWSGFDFNFRNSKIFYPLNDINIESPNFNGATFIINANFQGSYLSGKASLINATFRAKAEFSRAIFNSELDKENSETIGAPERFDEKIITNSTFYKTVFEQEVSFTDSMFLQCPEFMNTKFMNDADFADSLFNFNTAKNLRLYSRNMLVGQTSMPSGPPDGFILPLGARLFDPGSWDEAHQEYRVSEPAKPLDESDEVEEDKTE